MVTLKQIDSSLFPILYESFLIDDDPLSNEQDWRNVFDYQWDNEQGHCGYAMLDRDAVVGMMGMVFSERRVNSVSHKFCNLHTWWVREDYRGRSLALLRPLLKLDDYTITHFTPCDKVRAISKRLGFEELSTKLRIVLPFVSRRQRADTAIVYDLDAIKERLDAHDRKIFQDHQPYGCGHLLIEDGDERCYALYTRVQRHRLPYCHVHYISNKEVFVERERLIRSSLIRRHGVAFVAFDVRLVEDVAFHRSFDFWAPSNGLYKSSVMAPDQIDNLYSDVVFLKLTVLPNMSHELTQLARGFLPFQRRRA